MGGGSGDKKPWLKGGYEETFLVEIRGEQNKNIVTREPITEQSRQEEGGCKPNHMNTDEKRKQRTQLFLNMGPNESRIVPKFQSVFVAWASTFEEHKQLAYWY